MTMVPVWSAGDQPSKLVVTVTVEARVVMGYEYTLKLEVDYGENIEAVLKALSTYDKGYKVGGRVCHDFRIETNIGEMPSATSGQCRTNDIVLTT